MLYILLNYFVTELFTRDYLPNFLCEWPTSGFITCKSLGQCMLACLQEVGCYSYNYNYDSKLCALVVATAGQANPLTADNGGWEFHMP